MEKDRVNITEQVHKVHANWTAEGNVTLKMCDSNVNVLDGLVNTRPTDSWDHLSCLASETPNPELHPVMSTISVWRTSDCPFRLSRFHLS